MLWEWGLEGYSPLAYYDLIEPGVPLASAPAWLKLAMGALLLGSLGVLSGFGSNTDPEAY